MTPWLSTLTAYRTPAGGVFMGTLDGHCDRPDRILVAKWYCDPWISQCELSCLQAASYCETAAVLPA